MGKLYNLFKNVCLLLVSASLLFLALEVSYRVYQKIAKDIPFTRSISEFQDKELGWKGKKVFGDTGTDKYKVFVVGDSFTAGQGVNEEDMYYSVIKEKNGAELFVYGGGGYGTLQEYIAIDKYIDEIKPDLVLLQVCANDFINNSWKLETASFGNNNLMVRPYLINNEVEYRYPKFFGEKRIFLATHFRLFYKITYEIDRLCSVLSRKGLLCSAEDRIKKEGTNFDDFEESVVVTGELMGKIKKRVGDVPIVVFSIGGEPYLTHFRNIFADNKIEFIGGIEKIVREYEGKGYDVRIGGGQHFNERGNRIVGETVAKELTRMGYGKKSAAVQM